MEGETEKEILGLLMQSPSGRNGQSWSSLKLGTRNFFWICHMDGGTQGIGLFCTALPGPKQGA